jgi:hypothetical protein
MGRHVRKQVVCAGSRILLAKIKAQRQRSGLGGEAAGKISVILRNKTRGRDIWCGMNRRLPKGAACFQPPTTGCAGGAQTFGKAAV